MTRLSIPKYLSVLTMLLLAASAARGETAARYEAVFSDGTRLEGDKVSGWGGHPRSPRLDNTALFDAKRPLRWLKNRSLQPWRMPAARIGYIEFVGGDRIVGRVIGSRPSSEAGGIHTPAHLLVMPAMSLQTPLHSKPPTPVRVLIGSIRRIVIEPTSSRPCRAGSLVYEDGRRVAFVGIRPGNDSLHLLLSDGSFNVKLANITRIHFPRIDPWDAYFRALGILSPACRSRLMRFETTGGLIVTGSELRFRALPYATDIHQTQALEHIKRLDEHLARLQKATKEQTEKFNKAHAEYTKQSAELDKQLKAARQSYEKARTDLHRRIDQQKKKDADQLTEKQGKIDREFKSADAAMVKRLAAEKPKKRDGMLKAFRLKQAKLRKTRARALKAEKSRLYKQRLKELADSDSREMQKFKSLKTDFQKRAGPLKAKFAQATALWEHHSRSINNARSQRATASGSGGSSATWQHVIQPAWSLDALQVPFSRICMWWLFAPDRVPLSLAHPTVSAAPPLQPWRVDRNAEGKLFRSGGREHGWGFGVHAYSELSFTLPRFANSFQSRLGLDHIVADGGCVRARVFGGSITEKPLYESGLLIGSKKTVDTGPIAIRSPAKGPKRLILQADTAHRGRPSGSDPLNIRDKLDWLDPVIGFDPAGLKDVVHRRAVEQLHSWMGWTVKFDKRGAYTWTSRFRRADWPKMNDFVMVIQAEKHPLVLSRELTVGPRDNWVSVDTETFEGDTFRRKILSLRIDKKEAKPELTPARQEWQKKNAPPMFAIGKYRGKKITLELTQAPGGKPLHWQGVKISKELPWAYRLAGILARAGHGDMQIPRVLGMAFHSRRMNDQEIIALIEIYRHGGIINFSSSAAGRAQPSDVNNVLVGEDWTGGDKTFKAFQKAPSLQSLILVKDSGISSAAVEKLLAVKPNLKVQYLERLPSSQGVRSTFWMQNRTGKKVGIYWITQDGRLSLRDTLDSTDHRKRHHSNVGSRFEAHVDGKRISKFTVTPGRIWEIRP